MKRKRKLLDWLIIITARSKGMLCCGSDDQIKKQWLNNELKAYTLFTHVILTGVLMVLDFSSYTSKNENTNSIILCTPPSKTHS